LDVWTFNFVTKLSLGALVSSVLKIVLQRLGLGFLTLFAVSIIIAFVVELLPGDITQAILGQSATPETVAAFR